MIIQCEQCDTKFNVPEGSVGPSGRVVRCSVCYHEWLALPEESDQNNPVATNDSSDLEASKKKDDLELLKQQLTQEMDEIVQDTPVDLSTSGAATNEESSERMRKGPAAKRYIPPKIPFYNLPIVKMLSIAACVVAVLSSIIITIAVSRSSIIKNIPAIADLMDKVNLNSHEFLKIEALDCVINEVQSSNNNGQSKELDVEVVIRNIDKIDATLADIRFTIFDANLNKLGALQMEPLKVIQSGATSTLNGRLTRVPLQTEFVLVDIGNKLDLLLRNTDHIEGGNENTTGSGQ